MGLQCAISRPWSLEAALMPWLLPWDARRIRSNTCWGGAASGETAATSSNTSLLQLKNFLQTLLNLRPVKTFYYQTSARGEIFLYIAQNIIWIKNILPARRKLLRDICIFDIWLMFSFDLTTHPKVEQHCLDLLITELENISNGKIFYDPLTSV